MSIFSEHQANIIREVCTVLCTQRKCTFYEMSFLACFVKVAGAFGKMRSSY